jgi:hypothetical protein
MTKGTFCKVHPARPGVGRASCRITLQKMKKPKYQLKTTLPLFEES